MGIQTRSDVQVFVYESRKYKRHILPWRDLAYHVGITRMGDLRLREVVASVASCQNKLNRGQA